MDGLIAKRWAAQMRAHECGFCEIYSVSLCEILRNVKSARPMRNFARFNGNAKTAVTKITYLYNSNVKSSQDEITCFGNVKLLIPITFPPWAQLFEGRLALNPGLNLTRVSISFVQKHFLG